MLSLVYLDRRIEWVFSFGRKGKKKKRLLKVGGEIDYRLGVWAGLLAKQ